MNNIEHKTLLTLQNLDVFYKHQQILSKVNLSLKQGEILGIIGESGCGKSTLLKSIIGILDKQNATIQGKITYQDLDLLQIKSDNWSTIRVNKIGMIFQNAQDTLCPIRTIKDHFIETVQQHHKISKQEILQQTLILFDKLNLKNGQDILNSYPFELSGGMCQRVEIALSIILKPALLLADEPTSALDTISQSQVIKELLLINQLFNTSIIIVTHNINIVKKIAHNIAIIEQGHIIEYAPTSQIINSPKKSYTKKLLNSVLYLNRG